MTKTPSLRPVVGGLVLLVGLLASLRPLVAQTTEAAPLVADTNDRILPGDAIRLKIWREPDLSGDLPVNELGVVTFPKLGPMQVTGLTSRVLQDTLVSDYGRYLRNPSIEVIHLRRVNVLGAVKNPGSYTVEPTQTIAGVLALAGGATPQGNLKKFELRRGDQVILSSLDQSTQFADLPIQSGDLLFVPEKSWMSRNGAVVIAAMITAGVAIGISVANHH